MPNEKKRFFTILDELNVEDANNSTQMVAVCPDLVYSQKTRAGGHVTMGVPARAFDRLRDDEYIPILVLIDRKEYEKRK